MRYLTLVALCCASVASQNIPSYIKICDYKAPDFKKCALDNGNSAIPHIVKGDKRLGIPPLNPLRLPRVDVDQNNFKLSLKDVSVFGLENVRLDSINLSKEKFDAELHIEYLEITGQYEIDGKILLLALKGQGPVNITAVGGDYSVKATFEPYTKKGVTYLKFKKPNLEFVLKRAYFDFGNLLAGDDRLGSEVNALLNESWEDVIKDLGVPIKETITTIIESIVGKILSKIPAHVVFPE